jgi:HNH endonuclease
MTILIVLLVSDFLMIYPAYSQEDAASTTTIADSGPSQQETNITIKIVVFLIFCYVGWTIYKRLKYKYGKYQKRQYFPTHVKEDTTRRQHYKCAICKSGTRVWDFDHKDGNRSNNDPSNCQALCPNCHAKKTRGLLKQ